MKTLTIKKGIFSYLLASVWMLAAVWLLTGFLRIVVGQFNPTTVVTTGQFLGGSLFTLSVGLAFLYLGLQLLSQRYVVSLEGIDVRRLINARFIYWDEIELLGEQATFAVGSSYKARLSNGETVTFFTSFMARPSESAKALIEAAYMSKADIEFRFVLGNEHGSPPYGIFVDDGKKV